MSRKILFYILMLTVLVFSLAYAQTAQLWKTGQTTSYATGDDGDLEKGVAWPNPRFVDNGDGTVTDNLTGLMWLKNANCFGAQTWQNAFNSVSGFNGGWATSTCGYTTSYNDWRLPNNKELFSLIDRSRYTPALPQGHPFVNVQNSSYWSGTPTPYQSWGTGSSIGYARTGDMAYGNRGYGPMFMNSYVWPVRTAPASTFYNLSVTKTGTGSGTVTSDPAGINCGTDCNEIYSSGAIVTLTATSDSGSTFDGWSGACTGTGTCNVTMDSAKSVTATFNLCTYSINPTSASYSASAGSGSVSVTADSTCSWTAVSNATWITITSGNNGTGNGVVNYTVAQNKNRNPRTGTMTIAGQTFTVNQNGR